MSDYQRTILHYAINAYGFLIPLHQRVTYAEFADLIEKSYDISDGRNGEVVRVLRGSDPHEQFDQIQASHGGRLSVIRDPQLLIRFSRYDEEGGLVDSGLEGFVRIRELLDGVGIDFPMTTSQKAEAAVVGYSRSVTANHSLPAVHGLHSDYLYQSLPAGWRHDRVIGMRGLSASMMSAIEAAFAEASRPSYGVIKPSKSSASMRM